MHTFSVAGKATSNEKRVTEFIGSVSVLVLAMGIDISVGGRFSFSLGRRIIILMRKAERPFTHPPLHSGFFSPYSPRVSVYY